MSEATKRACFPFEAPESLSGINVSSCLKIIDSFVFNFRVSASLPLWQTYLPSVEFDRLTLSLTALSSANLTFRLWNGDFAASLSCWREPDLIRAGDAVLWTPNPKILKSSDLLRFLTDFWMVFTVFGSRSKLLGSLVRSGSLLLNIPSCSLLMLWKIRVKAWSISLSYLLECFLDGWWLISFVGLKSLIAGTTSCILQPVVRSSRFKATQVSTHLLIWMISIDHSIYTNETL